MDKQKQTLLDAYVRKIIALSKLQIIDGKNKVDDNEASSASLEEFDSIHTDVGKFTDYNDSKVMLCSFLYLYIYFFILFDFEMPIRGEEVSSVFLENFFSLCNTTTANR
jgi:hypothetical protein